MTNQGNKRIKIAVVSAYFFPKIGGLETIAYTTAKKLVESGSYEVSIITTNYNGKGYKKESFDGLTVHRLPIWFTFSNSPINLLWYFTIRKILKNEGVQLVQTHSPVPFIADVAVIAANNLKIPVVATYHSGSMKKNNRILDPIIYIYEKIFLRWMFRNSTKVVTVHQEFMNKNYSEFSYKTSFIPTGVDLNRFTNTKIINKNKATFVGRIELSSKWKGISYLLEALSIVLKKIPDARVELVGGGDAVDYYKKIAQDLGIGNSVDILGPKFGQDLVDVYKNTTVVVLPSTSDSEAFSVTLVEAMASGRPIIGTKIGGTPQVIQDGNNGLLIEPKNSQMLADALIKIFSDEDYANILGQNGANISKDYSWEKQVAKYDELYRGILE